MTPQPDAVLAASAAYQAQQVTLREKFARQFLALWPVLDKLHVGKSSPDWLRLAIGLIAQWRDASSMLGAEHFVKMHEIQTGLQTSRPPLAPDLPNIAIVKDLLWAGPGELKRSRLMGLADGVDGLPNVRADQRAQLLSTEVASKLVLSGGRDTTVAAVHADKRALGFMRVPDDDPCYFCAMLASRGPVYKTAESAGELNDWHPDCDCHVEAIFTRNAAIPAASKGYADLWKTSTAGKSGQEAINAFRAAYNAAKKQAQ